MNIWGGNYFPWLTLNISSGKSVKRSIQYLMTSVYVSLHIIDSTNFQAGDISTVLLINHKKNMSYIMKYLSSSILLSRGLSTFQNIFLHKGVTFISVPIELRMCSKYQNTESMFQTFYVSYAKGKYLSTVK